jgi:FKBP-type peptidyl-prolyl cis-trans isomerase 2
MIAWHPLQGDPLPGLLEPGMRVFHPARPDWGTGQVQSVIGDRITVNFEHAGKVLINAAVVQLEPAAEDAG